LDPHINHLLGDKGKMQRLLFDGTHHDPIGRLAAEAGKINEHTNPRCNDVPYSFEK
jgi:hypothetical protein